MFTAQEGAPKEKKNDRVLVLEVIDGLKPLSSTGLTDPRLFKGGNKLHAIMDDQSLMWSFKQDAGGLPPELKQKFTNFRVLKEYADEYYRKRNLCIKEVID